MITIILYIVLIDLQDVEVKKYGFINLQQNICNQSNKCVIIYFAWSFVYILVEPFLKPKVFERQKRETEDKGWKKSWRQKTQRAILSDRPDKQHRLFDRSSFETWSFSLHKD
jgi:hypothetical protein